MVSPCKNGGTCYEEKGDFRCICTREWKGKDCSESMIFFVVICRDYAVIFAGGFCSKDTTSKLCKEYCVLFLDTTSLCIGYRCLNGGTCRISEDGKDRYCVCRGPRFKPPDCGKK